MDTYKKLLMVFIVAQNMSLFSLVSSLHNINVLILCMFGLITPHHSQYHSIFPQGPVMLT